MARVLIIGSGGREHALGWKLSQSPHVSDVFYMPGNCGTEEGKGKNIQIDGAKRENFYNVYSVIMDKKIDLTVVGPEGPLDEGIVDYLRFKRIERVFGPSRKAAGIESDKFFSRDLMEKLGIPQARSLEAYNFNDAMNAIKVLSSEKGVVIKARGLTGGKGVSVCNNLEDSNEELRKINERYGLEVLISERLEGEEFSVFGISDGEVVYPINISFQDHKRLFDGDKGPNTGGMGAYGPTNVAPEGVVREISQTILNPIVREMKERGISYKGFIYAGMMMTEEGPKVLEFNCRFGDPECQPAMMMIKDDLYEILSNAVEGRPNKEIEINPWASSCIVLASPGYPESRKDGIEIEGLEDLNQYEAIKVFHAGTKKVGRDILTNGGRVLGVTAYATMPSHATELAYVAVSKIISNPSLIYRRDIGSRLKEKII